MRFESAFLVYYDYFVINFFFQVLLIIFDFFHISA